MLKEAILSAKQSAWSAALPQLEVLLRAAEQQVLAYSRGLVNNPDMDVTTNQDLIANRRGELIAQAIISFHEQLFNAEADAEAMAVLEYLQAHNRCVIIPGSMANSGGTVMPSMGGDIATIVYTP